MASCSTSAIAPHAPLLRFRINVTGGDSVRAKIDYLDPDIEDEEEACTDDMEDVADGVATAKEPQR